MGIYYSPESYGLKTVFDVDKSDGCYQFDCFVIWQSVDNEGLYLWGSDAGCSCPGHFEGRGRDDLASGSLRDAINDAFAWITSDMYGDTPDQYEREARRSIERFRDEQGL